MNSISSIALHINASNESFIREWYRDFESFAEKHIMAVTDRVLMRCDQYGFEIEISRLDLDLGSISEDDFETDFERLLEEKLEESLLREILYPSRKEDKRLGEADYQLEALKQFLLHGRLPWNLAQRFKNIAGLFQSVLKAKSKELAAFLRSYGHYSSLQQRMVYQLDDPNLFDVVRLVAPAEFSFIRSYVTFLRVKYAEAPGVLIREEERRNTIWKVVYAYLLSNQSAAFNRKLFVKGTIGNLASHINLSYEELLRVLTSFPDQGSGGVIPAGLQLILKELKAEEYAVFMSVRVQKPEEWPHILRELKSSGKAFKLPQTDLDHLRSLLENEKYVLQIIRPMAETEIFDLVRLLVPADAPFVIEYSGHLNKQNQSGALQGKSGGDFILFKWQVILPLLALSKNSAVNREYLVWMVFKRLSARYNIELWQIIAFAYSEIHSWNTRSDLRKLVEDLYTQLVQGKTKSAQLKTFDALTFQYQLLTEKTRLTKEQVIELKKKLSASVFRELLLDQLNESTRYRLLAIILPAKAVELSAFMQLLDHSGNGVKIEGKIIGPIQRLKWTFLFDVLEELKSQAFNHESIVRRILERTGAHYNLSLKQLVDYFYLDFANSNYSLPFNLFQVLSSIRQKIKLNGDPEVTDNDQPSEKHLENKKLLLRYFTGNEQTMPLINAISQDTEQVKFLIPVLETVQRMVDFISKKWNIRVDEQAMIRLIFGFSKKTGHYSQKELLREFWLLIREQLSQQQRFRFIREFLLPHKQDALIRQLQAELENEVKSEEKEEEEEEIPEELMETISEYSFIDNAGLVLLAPFLPQLFTMLQLTENGKFKDRDAQIKAIFLTQYAVFGNGDFPEYELHLNKLLTNFKTGVPIPRKSVLTDDDKSIVDGMLEGVLKNWGRLTNTTIDGLREGFLQREGRLEEQEDTYLLTVESKGYDMLLDHVPWNFRTIKFSWMQKGIQVKWR